MYLFGENQASNKLTSMKGLFKIVMSLFWVMTAFATAGAQNSKITITVNGTSLETNAQNIEISQDGVSVDGKQLTSDRPLTVVINGNVANLSVTGGKVTVSKVSNLAVINGAATVKEVTERVTAISSQIRIETNKGSIMNQAIQDGSGNTQYNHFR